MFHRDMFHRDTSDLPRRPSLQVSEAGSSTSGASYVGEILPLHVEAVKKGLHPEFRNCNEADIRRFIKATGGNIPLATKRLNTTLSWRRHAKPELVICTACRRDPQSHYMHIVGYDIYDRPIIYSCLAMASNRDYEDNKAHMIQTFEMAIKCMPPGIEQWVWVCDFHGFGMADINPRLAKAFLDISAEHYPERLGLFMVVDAPSMFNMLWRAISPFVDPKTYRKIRFLPFDPDAKKGSKLRAEMVKEFGEEQTRWFMREMAENRDKKVRGHKVYDMSRMFKAARQRQLHSVESPTAHDFRGSTKLLNKFNNSPDLLEPQGSA